jgi:hypothetical protein
MPQFLEQLSVEESIQDVVGGRNKLSERLDHIVLGPPKSATGQIGVFAACHGVGWSHGEWYLSVTGLQFLRITNRFEQLGRSMVNAKPLKRDAKTASAGALAALKIHFAEYAARNVKYRKEVQGPNFEVERIAAMKSAEGITNLLIRHVPIDERKRVELIALSVADRVRELDKILTSPDTD